MVCFRPVLHGVNALNTVRFESNAAISQNNSKTSPTLWLVAQEHIVKSNPTNSEVINSVLLANQKVAITQKELDVLLSLPSVKYDLPITDETHPSLLALIIKHSKRSNTGVYVFTHNPTGNKYVGSSNDLARRFKQYFCATQEDLLFANKNYGLLIPFISKEGLNAFSLQVIVVPYSYPKYSYCFLEQYFLLDKSFNLNTQRIVNFRVNLGLAKFYTI